MGFHEIVQQIENPGEDGLPDSIYADLRAEYDLLSEGSAGRVAELQEKLKAKESEISALKSRNYDLLMSSGASDGSDDEKEETSDKDDRQGIDRLF